MPELPEVETIRRQLSENLPGLTLEKLELFEEKLKAALSSEAVAKLFGKKIAAVERVAKVLLLRLENGDYLAFHLKMTGQVVINSPKFPNRPNRFNRATLTFSNEVQIFFQDLRKFGWLKILAAKDVPSALFKGELGPEPFSKEFSLKYFSSILKKSRKPIKVLLLDQSLIAGIGNIYANEALFMARVNPKTQSCDLAEPKLGALYQAILQVLEKGIKLGGASDNSYLNAFGKQGEYQKHFLVYGRQQGKCFKCSNKIIRIALGGRGTFFCPKCQA